tara:strand:+ start:369 stop:476 length:108 start_codon:yes stop_codon:yes gene_type:complete
MENVNIELLTALLLKEQGDPSSLAPYLHKAQEHSR